MICVVCAVLQTITDHVGVTSEAFSGVATICVTKTGNYCVLLATLLCYFLLYCVVFVSEMK